MLLPAGHLGFEPVVGEIELKAEADPVDEIAAQFSQLLEPAGNRRIGIRFEFPKRERLHLGHHLIHADPLGERGVDLHRFARDPAAFFLRGDMMERAHVVQPVGQLH